MKFLIAFLLMVGTAFGGTSFKVTNLPPEQAKIYEDAANIAYKSQSKYWFGKEHPDLSDVCRIKVVLKKGNGGYTRFIIDRERNEVYGWDMMVQGSKEAILRSVLPHEVNHIVFAAKFRRPLPRWLDEGCSVLFETYAERKILIDGIHKSLTKIGDFYKARDLMPITAYPKDGRKLFLLYGQGAMMVQYLHATYGPSKLVAYTHAVLKTNPIEALRTTYGLSPEALDRAWRPWFMAKYFSKEKSKTETKRIVYVFTADGRWCAPCNRFWKDNENGLFRGTKFVKVKKNSKEWVRYSAEYARATGKNPKLIGVPTFWVRGTRHHQVGYTGPRGLLGFIGSVFRGIIKGVVGLITGPPTVQPNGDANTSILREDIDKVIKDIHDLKNGNAIEKIKAVTSIKKDVAAVKTGAAQALQERKELYELLKKLKDALPSLIADVRALKDKPPIEKAKAFIEITKKVEGLKTGSDGKIANLQEKLQTAIKGTSDLKKGVDELKSAEGPLAKGIAAYKLANEARNNVHELRTGVEADRPPFGIPTWASHIITFVIGAGSLWGGFALTARNRIRKLIGKELVADKEKPATESPA